MAAVAVVLAAAVVAMGGLWSGSCTDHEIVKLLEGPVAKAVADHCTAYLTQGVGRGRSPYACPEACHRAVREFVQDRCYGDISRPQKGQPRWSGLGSLGLLPGTWLGLYPTGSLELVIVREDDRRGDMILVATKLTGNAYMRSGRVSWEATTKACRVQSSEHPGAFVPRWDTCSISVHDADHFTVHLQLPGAHGDRIDFVRALQSHVLAWDQPQSPTFRLGTAIEACGSRTASWSWVLDELSSTGRKAVIVDQLLITLPVLVAVVGWHVHEHQQQYRRWVLATALCLPGYLLLAHSRLRALGVWEEVEWFLFRFLFGAPLAGFAG